MASGRARIVLADHQMLFRQSLAYYLRNSGHMVVCEASDGFALERCMMDSQPDILILDRYLPGIDSLAYCRAVNSLQPHIQVLLLIAYEHEAKTLQSTAFLSGAAGCLSKDLEPAAYLAAIRQLLDGHLLFHPEVMRRAARPYKATGAGSRLHDLTRRELEILRLVAEGRSNREIAGQLGISYHTAMKHVSNIIAKLKVSNRMEAGLLFIREGPADPGQQPREHGR